MIWETALLGVHVLVRYAGRIRAPASRQGGRTWARGLRQRLVGSLSRRRLGNFLSRTTAILATVFFPVEPRVDLFGSMRTGAEGHHEVGAVQTARKARRARHQELRKLSRADVPQGAAPASPAPRPPVAGEGRRVEAGDVPKYT